MLKHILVLFASLGPMAGLAAAQDARAVLQAASTVMGAGNLTSIEYAGIGWVAAPGQSHSPNDDWPRFEVTSYTRAIDYMAGSSREELTRRQGTYPVRGGGSPIQGEQRQVLLTAGTYAWNLQGDMVSAAPAAAEVRQLDLWLSPHGFVKAALAANPTAASMMLEGRRVTIVSFTALGKYRVNGTITEDNLVERVQTWVANPVLGDMAYEHRYTEYKTFGGVKFPTVLHSHQGDPRLNAGHNWMEIKVSQVRPNATVAPLSVPETVRQATIPTVRVDSQRLANGVWLIGGGSHNSLAVEFRDFIAVVEAPLNEQRSLAVIGEVRKLVPSKPIRYLVNTHHHFDHLGGIRTYLTESAAIVTHQGNREFYEQVVLYPAPRTLEPDRLSTLYPWFSGNRVPAIEPVAQKFVISDGVRTMDVYPVQGLTHNANMLIAYLPTEKILVNADLYSPPAPGAQPPPAPSPAMVVLRQTIRQLRLDVAQHAPVHGRPGTHDEFLKLVGTSPN